MPTIEGSGGQPAIDDAEELPVTVLWRRSLFDTYVDWSLTSRDVAGQEVQRDRRNSVITLPSSARNTLSLLGKEGLGEAVDKDVDTGYRPGTRLEQLAVRETWRRMR
jgi:hypothetical protein